jgi:hypothetical protein
VIRVLQSLGRGLRMTEGKSKMTLYDLADDFRHGKSENHTFKHFGERLGIYSEEHFDYNITTVDLKEVIA